MKAHINKPSQLSLQICFTSVYVHSGTINDVLYPCVREKLKHMEDVSPVEDGPIYPS